MLKNDVNSKCKLNVHYVNKLCAISSQGISNELNFMYLMANNRNIVFISLANWILNRQKMRYFYIFALCVPLTQTNGKVCVCVCQICRREEFVFFLSLIGRQFSNPEMEHMAKCESNFCREWWMVNQFKISFHFVLQKVNHINESQRFKESLFFFSFHEWLRFLYYSVIIFPLHSQKLKIEAMQRLVAKGG